MSQPLYGALYADVPQTGVAVRRMQSDARFITLRAVPVLIVKKPSGLYTVFNMGDLNRDEMQARGPTATPQIGGFRKSKAAFDTDARSLAYDLNDAEAAGADVEENPETTIPRVLAYKANIHLERRMAGKFFGAAHPWYRTVTGAGADNAGTATAKDRLYLDNANADPVEALNDEIRILEILTGMSRMDMCLMFGNRVWHKVRNHAKVKSQIVGLAGSAIGNAVVAMARQADPDEFARLLGVKKVFVSTAIYNAKAMNSDATEVPDNQPIVPQDEILLYVNATAGEENGDALMTLQSDTPSALCRPVWNGVASAQGVQVRKYRDENAGAGGSWRHVIDVYNGMQSVSTECATIFRGMVTP